MGGPAGPNEVPQEYVLVLGNRADAASTDQIDAPNGLKDSRVLVKPSSGHSTDHPRKFLKRVTAAEVQGTQRRTLRRAAAQASLSRTRSANLPENNKEALKEQAKSALHKLGGYHLQIITSRGHQMTPRDLENAMKNFTKWYDVYEEKTIACYGPNSGESKFVKNHRPEWEIAQRQKLDTLRGNGKLTDAEYNRILAAQHTSLAVAASQTAPTAAAVAKK